MPWSRIPGFPGTSLQVGNRFFPRGDAFITDGNGNFFLFDDRFVSDVIVGVDTRFDVVARRVFRTSPDTAAPPSWPTGFPFLVLSVGILFLTDRSDSQGFLVVVFDIVRFGGFNGCGLGAFQAGPAPSATASATARLVRRIVFADVAGLANVRIVQGRGVFDKQIVCECVRRFGSRRFRPAGIRTATTRTRSFGRRRTRNGLINSRGKVLARGSRFRGTARGFGAFRAFGSFRPLGSV